VLMGLPWDGYIETLPIRSLEFARGRVPITAKQSSPPKEIYIRVLGTQNIGVTAVPRYDEDEETPVEELPEQSVDTVVAPRTLNRPRRLAIPKPPLGDEWSVRIWKRGASPVFILGFDVTVDADPNSLSVTGQ